MDCDLRQFRRNLLPCKYTNRTSASANLFFIYYVYNIAVNILHNPAMHVLWILLFNQLCSLIFIFIPSVKLCFDE